VAFDKLKGFLGLKKTTRPQAAREYERVDFTPSKQTSARQSPVAKPKRPPRDRTNRKPDSPYTREPRLQNINIAAIEKYISRNYKKLRTDKWTFLEIADIILAKEIGMPRPAKLKAHMMFAMFVKRGGRVRSGVKTPCHQWMGSLHKGAAAVTTINSHEKRRIIVDARKYIMENPPRGKRRNFRSIPMNLCGNDLCVNPQHIRMVPRNPLRHQGENHPRSKYNDKAVVKMVKEYNAGASAKEVARKYDISLTYVEQIVRKEKRTQATEGMTIRGRFGSR
jgi:hypothetical protein